MTELADLVAPQSTALLVVDIQNDYIHPEGTLASSGEDTSPVIEMIPRLKTLIAAARSSAVPIFFARNWHSARTDSEAWVSRAGRRRGGRRAGLADSWGADWYEVEPQPEDVIINKFRYDAFLGTPLEMMLRARKIETVVCCGTATNVCVESTARAAHMRDFHLVLAGDCCACTDQRLHEATLLNIARHFGRVVPSEELIRVWQADEQETGSQEGAGRSAGAVAGATPGA